MTDIQAADFNFSPEHRAYFDELCLAVKDAQDYPDHWDQSDWHCNTSHCVAGFGDMRRNGLSPQDVWPQTTRLSAFAIDYPYWGLDAEIFSGGNTLKMILEYLEQIRVYGFEYNGEGYNIHGYDEEGYDEDGYDRYDLDRNGFDSDGYGRDGYDYEGYNYEGYDREGYDRNGYDEDGFDRYDLDRNGFDSDGYDYEGYNYDGYDYEGYDREGYDRNGYDEDGFDREGFNSHGFDRVREATATVLLTLSIKDLGLEFEVRASGIKPYPNTMGSVWLAEKCLDDETSNHGFVGSWERFIELWPQFADVTPPPTWHEVNEGVREYPYEWQHIADVSGIEAS